MASKNQHETADELKHQLMEPDLDLSAFEEIGRRTAQRLEEQIINEVLYGNSNINTPRGYVKNPAPQRKNP